MTVTVRLWMVLVAALWLVVAAFGGFRDRNDFGIVETMTLLLCVIGSLAILLVHAWGWL